MHINPVREGRDLARRTAAADKRADATDATKEERARLRQQAVDEHYETRPQRAAGRIRSWRA